jgi:hypothetical protein
MDRAFENINEKVDYEWDLKNNTETNHNTGATIDYKNKTVEWLMSSLNKSTDKAKWYKRFLSKIAEVNPKIKKAILISIIPIMIGSIGGNTVDDITHEVCVDGSVENNIIANIIAKYPDMDKEKKILANKLKKASDTEEEKIDDKSFDAFIKNVAFRESSGRWDVSNSGGFMGLYQIGKESLRDASQRTKDPDLKDLHKKITKKKFDNDPNIFSVELQTKVFKQLLKNNRHYLRRYKKYIGQTIGGIKITESGLLGAAHLVGNGGIKKFLRSGGKKDDTDGNGTKCSEYLKLFSDYEIDLS